MESRSDYIKLTDHSLSRLLNLEPHLDEISRKLLAFVVDKCLLIAADPLIPFGPQRSTFDSRLAILDSQIDAIDMERVFENALQIASVRDGLHCEDEMLGSRIAAVKETYTQQMNKIQAFIDSGSMVRRALISRTQLKSFLGQRLTK